MTDKILSREEIFATDDLKMELVPVPEWGGSVYVLGLMGDERDAWEGSLVVKTKRLKGHKRGGSKVVTKGIRAKLAAITVTDAEKNLLFSPSDIEALGRKSAAALDRIFEVAQRLSGLSDDDIEDLAKNSGSTPADDSTAA
jgi:hypothetical protein